MNKQSSPNHISTMHLPLWSPSSRQNNHFYRVGLYEPIEIRIVVQVKTKKINS